MTVPVGPFGGETVMAGVAAATVLAVRSMRNRNVRPDAIDRLAAARILDCRLLKGNTFSSE